MKLTWETLEGSLKGCFFVWGMFSFLAVLFFGVLIFYSLTLGTRSASKDAAKQDVRFVLNNCKLGDARIEKIVHSRVSGRSFTGDHLDAHAIRVTHLDASELVFDNKYGRANGWYRGDELTGFPDAVVGFVASWLWDIPWFPTVEEIRSPSTYVWIVSTRTSGTRPHAVQVIFAMPEKKMIYWFSAKS